MPLFIHFGSTQVFYTIPSLSAINTWHLFIGLAARPIVAHHDQQRRAAAEEAKTVRSKGVLLMSVGREDGAEVIIEVHRSREGLFLSLFKYNFFHVSCLCEDEVVVGR